MIIAVSAGDVLLFLAIAAVGYIVVAWVLGRINRSFSPRETWGPAEPEAPPAGEPAPGNETDAARREPSAPATPYRMCSNPECHQIAAAGAQFCPRCGARLPPER